MRIGIVIGEFHKELADEMLAAAEAAAKGLGAEVAEVVWVPGSLEAPLALKRMLGKGGFDALVVLGYIERGETRHGEVMGHVVTQACMQMQLDSGIPIGMGVIGPGATLEQAKPRAKSTAERAVSAAVRMAQR